jgi:hypothetical protein
VRVISCSCERQTGCLFFKRVEEYRETVRQYLPAIVLSPSTIAAAEKNVASHHQQHLPSIARVGAPSPSSSSLTRHIPSSPPVAPSCISIGESMRGPVSAAPTLPTTSSTTLLLAQSDAHEHVQQHLLAVLIEANAIYSHYIDNGAPNELNLSQTMRHGIRATLDNLLLRAAMAGNFTTSGSSGGSGTTSHRGSNNDCSPVAVGAATGLVSRGGVTVSRQLHVDEAYSFLRELLTIFDASQKIVVGYLDAHCFDRFRTSNGFSQLISGLRREAMDGTSPSQPSHPRRMKINTIAPQPSNDPRQQQQNMNANALDKIDELPSTFDAPVAAIGLTLAIPASIRRAANTLRSTASSPNDRKSDDGDFPSSPWNNSHNGAPTSGLAFGPTSGVHTAAMSHYNVIDSHHTIHSDIDTTNEHNYNAFGTVAGEGGGEVDVSTTTPIAARQINGYHHHQYQIDAESSITGDGHGMGSMIMSASSQGLGFGDAFMPRHIAPPSTTSGVSAETAPSTPIPLMNPLAIIV